MPSVQGMDWTYYTAPRACMGNGFQKPTSCLGVKNSRLASLHSTSEQLTVQI